MSAEWVRPGERIHSRELIEKHGDDLAGLLTEPLPTLSRMIWDPPTAILLTQKEMDSIVKTPGEIRKATVDEIEAALCGGQTPTEDLPNPVIVNGAFGRTRFGKWCSKNDGRNGGLVFILAVVAVFLGVFAAIDAARTADYANDTCRADGAWVQCEGVRLRVDGIERVAVIRDGDYGSKELAVHYAGSTETVQVGAAHLDEALALLGRPKSK